MLVRWQYRVLVRATQGSEEPISSTCAEGLEHFLAMKLEQNSVSRSALDKEFKVRNVVR